MGSRNFPPNERILQIQSELKDAYEALQSDLYQQYRYSRPLKRSFNHNDMDKTLRPEKILIRIHGLHELSNTNNVTSIITPAPVSDGSHAHRLTTSMKFWLESPRKLLFNFT